MVAIGETYDLKHLRKGIALNILLRECSVSYVDKLRKSGLIYMDENKLVHLTDKGKVALEMGVDHYLKLEEMEATALNTDIKQLRKQNNYLVALLIILLFSFIFGMISLFT